MEFGVPHLVKSQWVTLSCLICSWFLCYESIRPGAYPQARATLWPIPYPIINNPPSTLSATTELTHISLQGVVTLRLPYYCKGYDETATTHHIPPTAHWDTYTYMYKDVYILPVYAHVYVRTYNIHADRHTGTMSVLRTTQSHPQAPYLKVKVVKETQLYSYHAINKSHVS